MFPNVPFCKNRYIHKRGAHLREWVYIPCHLIGMNFAYIVNEFFVELHSNEY